MKSFSLTPFGVRECVPGEGQLLGSMFLKPAFCQSAKDRVAGQVDMDFVDEADLDTEIQLAWERVESEGHRAVDRDNWSHTLRVSLSDGTLHRRIKLAG
jgi:hypothetical protein